MPDGEPAQFDLIYVFGPVDDVLIATLEVQVATAAWTSWKFDSAGKPLESEETNASLSALREKVEILRAGPSEDGIAIWTRPFSSTTEAAEFKLVAIDKTEMSISVTELRGWK